MTRATFRFLAALGVVWLTALPGGTLPAAAADKIKKIVIVVLENTAESEAVKMPYLATLAKRGALLSNDHAEVHPSQPNYIAMIAGSSYGVDDGSMATDASRSTSGTSAISSRSTD